MCTKVMHGVFGYKYPKTYINVPIYILHCVYNTEACQQQELTFEPSLGAIAWPQKHVIKVVDGMHDSVPVGIWLRAFGDVFFACVDK